MMAYKDIYYLNLRADIIKCWPYKMWDYPSAVFPALPLSVNIKCYGYAYTSSHSGVDCQPFKKSRKES